MQRRPTPTVTRPPADFDEPPAHPLLPDRWELRQRLGWGGQAEVWLARDGQLDRMVALKIFLPRPGPDNLSRIRREVNAGRDLVHPNLVRVYELIEADGRLAVAMEWLPGGSLKARAEAGPLAIDEVVKVVDDTLQALEFLHDRHVLHRDVKPANLLVGSDGGVRLADLGLVKPLDQPDLTAAAACVGTTEYMSPEQLRNQTLTPATDLYSLGASIYELLTGRSPFAADSDAEVIQGHIKRLPQDPRRMRPDCPRWLARFTLRLLEKLPRDRFPDARAARLAFVRRGSLVSPRVYRRAARIAASVAALIVVGAVVVRVVGLRVEVPSTVRVERVGTRLVGTDARGAQRWSYSFQSPVQQAVRIDLDGDGRNETIAAAFPTSASRSGSRAESEVVIIRNSGDIITRVRPEQRLAAWPSDFRKLVDPFIKVVDVDGDGTPEVVLLCTSRDSCHCAVLVYWPKWNVWDTVFLNSGYLDDVVAVRDATRPRIRFLGYNNNLGMVPVIGELALRPPPSRSQGAHEGGVIRSPDESWGFGGKPFGGLDWYVPLPQLDRRGRATDLSVTASGTTAITFAGHPLELDRFLDPTPGPNAGRDLSALREWFFTRLGDLEGSGTPVAERGIAAIETDVRSRAAALLAEAPYRVILAESVADALLREGRRELAIDELTRARRVDPYEDITYRLALLDALGGNLGEARSLLEGVTAAPSTPAGDTRGRRALMFLAVEQHDEATFKQMLAEIAHGSRTREDREGVVAALWARARLWWDRPREGDGHVTSWDYEPAGEAVACLVRWRRGETISGDVAEMDAFVRANPDMALAGDVARSAALLGTGRAPEAVAALARTTQMLDVNPPDLRNPEAFADLQFGQLARALYATSLAAVGRWEQARALAQRLRPTLTAGLLPRVLLDHVLAPAARR